MGFLLRAGLVIGFVYVLSPLSDGAPPSPAHLAAETEAAVRREAQAMAAAALDRCRREPAKCLDTFTRTGSLPLPSPVPGR
jgi:hypothetical protein